MLLTILCELVAEEICEVVVIREDVRFGRGLRCTLLRCDVGYERRRACGRVRVVTRPAMHARDESALRASRVRGHKLGRFDLDAMNRAGRIVAASAGIGAAAVRAGRAVARVIFIARIAAQLSQRARAPGAPLRLRAPLRARRPQPD